MVTGTVLLLCVAVLLRLTGSLAFSIRASVVLDCLGWLLCLTSVWVASGVAGAFSPLWMVVAAAGIAILVDRSRRSVYSMPAVEALLVLALGLGSIPPLNPALLLILMIIIPFAAMVIDKLSWRINFPRGRIILVVSISAAVLGFVVDCQSRIKLYPKHYLHNSLLLSVSPGLLAEKVTLDSGAVGWLNRPRGAGPFPGIVLFHGAKASGANQPAAIALRRAFLYLDCVVLAVDHPGFGHSPAIPASDTVKNWDPLPTDRAAVRYLQELDDVDGVYVAGHSMGCVDVLRLLELPLNLRGGFLIGASHFENEYRVDYWFDRFHSDRRMNDRLTMEKYLEIHRRYYDRRRLVEALHAKHPPIFELRFRHEWQDIRDSRDELYARIPGRKITGEADATHYFNSIEVDGIMLMHTRPVRSVAAKMRTFISDTYSYPETELR